MTTRLPYVVATLALTALAALFITGQGLARRPGPSLERAAGTVSRPAPALPSARQIIERGRDLGLRPDQIARLEALDARWRREAHAVDAPLEAAARQLAAFMKEAQDRRGASLAELQRRSADYRELSAELRERRLRHAAETLAVLSPSQRPLLGPMTTISISGDPR
jgi:hypothetical protein